MATAKQKYRVFLGSKFWKDLSAQKRALVGKCERCGSAKSLQSHHKFYRAKWEQTTLDDLEVLCRACHRCEHGIVRVWMILHRDDIRFSRFIHYIGYLQRRLHRFESKALLKPRERSYLDSALAHYPSEETDGCMEFHVKQCLRLNEAVKNFL